MKLTDLKGKQIRIYYVNQEEGVDSILIDVVEDYGLLIEFDDMGGYQEIIPFGRIDGIGLEVLT